MKEYINRYNDTFTFTYNEKGNIQWSGPFKYIRCAHPNDYTEAYKEYCRYGGDMSLDSFKEEIHKYNTETFESSELSKKYASLVGSDPSKIHMVDPSGGPYISAGYDMKLFGLKGIVENFIRNENGYEIVITSYGS